MTVPQAREDPRLRRFAPRRWRISAARGGLSVVAPQSMESVLAGGAVRRFDDRGEIPYWARIWATSVGMARMLLRGPAQGGRRALDLGCGIGLAGTAAGRRGAAVLFADRDPDALRFARFNALHNGVRDCATLAVDWLRKTVPGCYDLLLLADVTYEASSHRPLLRHIERCVVHGGRALHGDPYREQAGRFLDAVARVFPVEIVATDTFFEGARVPLRLAWIGEGAD